MAQTAVEEIRDRKRAACRAYYAANSDRLRAYAKARYHARREAEGEEAFRDSQRAESKQYRAANREKLNAQSRARYAQKRQMQTEEEREERRKRDRDYARARYRQNPEFYKAKAREYRARNPEKVSERNFIWQQRNREYDLAQSRRYRDQQLANLGGRGATGAPIKPPRGGQPWTRAEDLVLLENPNLTTIELCYMLGRSFQSVQIRRRKVERSGGQIETFTVPNGWLNTRQIATRLGCSYSAAVAIGRKFGERKAPRNGWLVREEVVCSYPYKKYRKRVKK